MGLVNSALVTGRNALLTYQSTLQIVGNNVANSGNANYTRQSGDMSGVTGVKIGPGLQPGAGVALTGLQRHIDEELENRLRASAGELESSAAQRNALSRIEVFFDDTSGAGISDNLVAFFNAMSDVQNAPDDLAMRSVALATGDALASSMKLARENLQALGASINDEIDLAVQEADRVASEIADLNAEIVKVEAGGKGQANALRDRRDALLRELSQTFDVAVREQPDGSINVYVGSEPLIQHGISRGLTTTDELDGEVARTSVRFADTNTRINVAGGVIEGMIIARDEHAYGRMQALDDLAAGVIAEVNAVHADGQGLTPFTEVIAGTSVDDPAAALNSLDAGLALPPSNGSFYITVADDATGTPTAYRIEIDLDGSGTETSLNDVAAAINNDVSGVTAEVTVDGRLRLAADSGFSFTFGHDGEQERADTSHLLAALGINTLFDGSTAADIAVRDALHADPGKLAAASANRVGDGINAGRMAGVIDQTSEMLGGTSILSAYNRIALDLASAGASAQAAVEAADAVYSSLTAQREGISGVSLDEEAIDLMKYERAFQGAARYVSTVDALLQEMLGLVG